MNRMTRQVILSFSSTNRQSEKYPSDSGPYSRTPPNTAPVIQLAVCDNHQHVRHVRHVRHLQRTDVTFDDICNIMNAIETSGRNKQS